MNGYNSLHPYTISQCEALGIKSVDIIQGVGYADASAGTHGKVGSFNGRDFGNCVDIPHRLINEDLVDRMISSGWCPFVRDSSTGWHGSIHVHIAIPNLPDDRGNTPIKDIVATQIIDFYNGRNGLAGHGLYQCKYSPTETQRQYIKNIYKQHQYQNVVKVYFKDARIFCYAFVNNDITRCELRPVAEMLGAKVNFSIHGLTIWKNGQQIEIKNCNVALEGNFMRCDIAPLVRNLGYTLNWYDGVPANIRIS